MTKSEFLKQLGKALSPLRRDEREKTLNYYSEQIDDRIESGLTEAEAVAEMEDIDVIAARTIADARERGALRPKRSVMTTVLLILGFPIWGSLLAALLAVLLAFYITVWALVISLYAIVFSLGVAGVTSVVGFGILLIPHTVTAVALLGAGLMAAAIGVVLFLPVITFSKGTWSACVGIWHKIVRKGGDIL